MKFIQSSKIRESLNQDQIASTLLSYLGKPDKETHDHFLWFVGRNNKVKIVLDKSNNGRVLIHFPCGSVFVISIKNIKEIEYFNVIDRMLIFYSYDKTRMEVVL